MKKIFLVLGIFLVIAVIAVAGIQINELIKKANNITEVKEAGGKVTAVVKNGEIVNTSKVHVKAIINETANITNVIINETLEGIYVPAKIGKMANNTTGIAK
ncbi:MAG: hypothetical protein CVT88_07575 [Candidatus Altiarchaeales archaeon HGW-Altiarchaeales-1]|nr:MAG: hypothetical protein CVT88_07575 [Candidatus Altiarchaeales archaeon HGW-Altiarchaeales-1]